MSERHALADVRRAIEAELLQRVPSWLNADEITRPGCYLWRRVAAAAVTAYEIWPIMIEERGNPVDLMVSIMDGLPFARVKGAPGRFYGPIPDDSHHG